MALDLLAIMFIISLVDPSCTAWIDQNQTEPTTGQNISSPSWSQTGSVTRRPTSTEDDPSQIQNQLENQTRLVVTEDEESFQEYEDHLLGGRCQQDLLVEASHAVCGSAFHQQMEHLGPDDLCVLDNVIRAYNDMTLCLESLAHWAGCFYPNANIQDFFLLVHSSYFLQCSHEERHLEDAPHWLSVALTLCTVAIIPALVYLVGWRSKVVTLH
ncbi:receptor activity-modifying protein 3-like [Dunckerocampus dactyliophorus]|uniref:receptor activity-modifying protein 3-like n=1 Tax=Dunckerocampus dactyliophorus TaxID=161453 RepID=UPI0024057DF2|nr:receptor activity-modifying protein 3-like [Dunckerocampus dactyliophorus]